MAAVTPAPLYRDPIHDGAADPTVIWDRAEQSWWMSAGAIDAAVHPMPGGTARWVMPYPYRRTSIQAARLELQDALLACDRNQVFQMNLQVPKEMLQS